MPFVKPTGARLHRVDGWGAPILFGHGISSAQRQWHLQVEALFQDLRVVVWDSQGHTQTMLSPCAVDPETSGQDLIALLDHLELPRAMLCRLSMGGPISLQTAARFPGRL
ncbi:MAG TPA: hypothetical protein VLY63_02280 [Anaerolineae bacterium]|nr:hypothetical protein [Anaerolineae bacterium]